MTEATQGQLEIDRLRTMLDDVSAERDYYRDELRVILKKAYADTDVRIDQALKTPSPAFLELWAAALDAVRDTRLVTHERFERLRKAVKALPNGEMP